MTTGIDYFNISGFTGEVWNPVTGCSGKNCPVRDTCWARAMVKRFPHIHGEWTSGYGGDQCDCIPKPFSKVQFHPDRLDKPLHWRKPRRIGICFMGDLFDEQVKFEWINEIFRKIWNSNRQSWHQYFFLTKQVENLRKYVEWNMSLNGWEPSRLKNVYLGVTVTSQADADRMIPELPRIPGKHWISAEPLLEPIKFTLQNTGMMVTREGISFKNWNVLSGKCGNLTTSKIDWVVVGCHNNPRRYPCKLEWIESIVEQCKAAGVPIYCKQISMKNKLIKDISLFPKNLQIKEFPK